MLLLAVRPFALSHVLPTFTLRAQTFLKQKKVLDVPTNIHFAAEYGYALWVYNIVQSWVVLFIFLVNVHHLCDITSIFEPWLNTFGDGHYSVIVYDVWIVYLKRSQPQECISRLVLHTDRVKYCNFVSCSLQLLSCKLSGFIHQAENHLNTRRSIRAVILVPVKYRNSCKIYKTTVSFFNLRCLWALLAEMK